MKRHIGILTALFTAIVLVIVGCGGALPTVNIDANVKARVQATLAANGQQQSTPPPMKASTETPSLVSPITTPEVNGAQPTAKQVSNKDGMTLLYVPAGEFTMGFSTQPPVHAVYLDAFWIDQTEVTNAMYVQCVRIGVCQPPASSKSRTRDRYYGNPQFDNYPVIYVTWNDALQYCDWAGRRLPSETEWEKAARGNDQRTYPWGNDAPDKTRLNYHAYDGEAGDTTQVGAHPTGASPYSALDMAGNVWEWVAAGGSGRVLRGGSWLDNAGISSKMWSSDDLNSRDEDAGFRCAR
jgi:eukaryotic-like serine/threonine-protein kinase